MNPNYQEFKFPQIRAYPWNSIFKNNAPPEVIDIISKMLEYVPEKRITAIAVSTSCFCFLIVFRFTWPNCVCFIIVCSTFMLRWVTSPECDIPWPIAYSCWNVPIYWSRISISITRSVDRTHLGCIWKWNCCCAEPKRLGTELRNDWYLRAFSEGVEGISRSYSSSYLFLKDPFLCWRVGCIWINYWLLLLLHPRVCELI